MVYRLCLAELNSHKIQKNILVDMKRCYCHGVKPVYKMKTKQMSELAVIMMVTVHKTKSNYCCFTNQCFSTYCNTTVAPFSKLKESKFCTLFLTSCNCLLSIGYRRGLFFQEISIFYAI